MKDGPCWSDPTWERGSQVDCMLCRAAASLAGSHPTLGRRPQFHNEPDPPRPWIITGYLHTCFRNQPALGIPVTDHKGSSCGWLLTDLNKFPLEAPTDCLRFGVSRDMLLVLCNELTNILVPKHKTQRSKLFLDIPDVRSFYKAITWFQTTFCK